MDYVKDDKAKPGGPRPAFEGYETWSCQKLCSYFAENGLGAYEECLMHHKITGKLAPLLTDQDLKDMGITCVGDRLRFRSHLNAWQRKVRTETRNRIMWEGKERLYFSTCEESIMTCCGCCPDDPSTYKLTANHLKVKTVKPARCGPITLCCCQEYSINNVDLTHVNDVDVLGIPSPCIQRVLCCADGKDNIDVQITGESGTGGKIVLVVKQDDGDHVASLIMDQIEEAQVMERD